MEISPLAGKTVDPHNLVNLPQLLSAYYTGIPDISVRSQRISFGTSGHRGTSLNNSFNENHILAISQAICEYRKKEKIEGPLFLGFDTHALSIPAFSTTMEVMAANGINVMIADKDEYTPTPVISFSILQYNQGRNSGLADGIVLTPSHNPPEDGGYKYNPTHGGPASSVITSWIENRANEILKNDLHSVKRISYQKALKSSTTHRIDFINPYVNSLGKVLDMEIIGHSKIKIGVDPLGGAGVHYWEPIAHKYGLNLSVVNTLVDPTFRFMTADWDGKIRMDPSSKYAMQGLIRLKDQFDIAFACDTDHDRHGIVSVSAGLLNPNHYLSVAVEYLLQNRPFWDSTSSIGKTVVTTGLIDRMLQKMGRRVYNVPVGFKWFSEGLYNQDLCFGGEESAGASFSRKDGSVWTTDKDGIILALLSAEITAKTKLDPGEHYQKLSKQYGKSFYDRQDAAATAEDKDKLAKLSSSQISDKQLAGEPILTILTKAPGNGASLGGLKVTTENGWFMARPSGTEDIYKIYAESFLDQHHLDLIIEEAKKVVANALKN